MTSKVLRHNYSKQITVVHSDKQTMEVGLQQANCSSTIMISLAFLFSKEKEKNIRGGRKVKLERKRGRRRN